MPLPQRTLASTLAEHKDDHLALNPSAPTSSSRDEHPAIHNAVHGAYGLPMRTFGSYSASQHLADHNTMHAAFESGGKTWAQTTGTWAQQSLAWKDL